MPKLAVGEVNDPLEREADAIADQVMRTPDSGVRLGRACASCEADEDKLQRSIVETPLRRTCASCEAEDEPLRRTELAAGARGGRASGHFTTQVHNLQRGGGRPLAPNARGFLEPRLGVGLGDVRVHADANAGQLAQQINSRAFTFGRHVFFGPG